MALKTELDSKSYRIVLIQSLVGAVVGGLPGLIYVFAAGSKQIDFGVGLIQVGAMVGGLSCGLAAAAGTIVASIKQRGTHPNTKAKRMQEYLNPETLPAIPPPAKPSPSDRASPVINEKTEILHRPVAEPISKIDLSETLIQPAQPVFEDFDHQQS